MCQSSGIIQLIPSPSPTLHFSLSSSTQKPGYVFIISQTDCRPVGRPRGSCLSSSVLGGDGDWWCSIQQHNLVQAANFAAFLLQCNFQTFLFHLAEPVETCTNFPLAQNLLLPPATATTGLTDLPHVLYNTSHHHTPHTPDCRTQPATRTDAFHSLTISEELPDPSEVPRPDDYPCGPVSRYHQTFTNMPVMTASPPPH